MTAEAFMADLAQVRLAAVFNPYADRCAAYDTSTSAEQRRDNLCAVLRAAWARPNGIMWVARDLGHRGGRRTGLPLTDEVHLGDFSAAWGGLPIRKATAGPPIAERTAAVIWATLRRMPEPVFLWNLFPLHPHPASDPLGNRAHTAAERKVGKVFLSQLLLALRPRIVIAIGGDAAAALADMEVPHVRVRHPSYGGHRDFCTGIAAAHGLPIEPVGLPMQAQIGLD
jgi:hypothetical protein